MKYTFTEHKTYDILPGGRVLVYYDEDASTETEVTPDGTEVSYPVWRYSRTTAPDPSRDSIIVALIRIRYSADEELALSRQREAKVAEFNAYSAYAEWCKAYAGFVLDGDTLANRKSLKVAELTAYDASPAVNSFSIGNAALWLSPAQRTNYLLTIEAAKEQGVESVPFEGVNLPVDTALAALKALNLYAMQCVAVTDAHRAAINGLETAEAVDAYDYTLGYPEKLSF